MKIDVMYALRLKPGDIYAGTVNPESPYRPVSDFAAAHELTEVTSYKDADRREWMQLKAGAASLTLIEASQQVIVIRTA
jgi:hypothetical protein